jgi:hypothetical protein
VRARLVAAALVLGCGAPATPAPRTAPAKPPAFTQVLRVTGGMVDTGSLGMGSIPSFAFTDDGAQLVVGEDGEVREIDAASRREVGHAQLASGRADNPHSRPGVHETIDWEIRSAVWTWDPAAHALVGAMMLGTFGDAVRGLALWAPGSGVLPTAVPVPAGETLCEPLVFSADRRELVTRVVTTANQPCNLADAVQVFAVPAGTPLSPPFIAKYPSRASLSRDNRYLAVQAQAIHVFDLTTQAQIRELAVDHASSVAMHPSRPLVAWGTANDEVYIAAIDAGRAGDAGKPVRVAAVGREVGFSPDGHYLAVSGASVSVVDATALGATGSAAAAGAAIVRLTDLRATPWYAGAPVFSDDSRQLAVGTLGGGLAIWRFGPDATTAAAPSRDWVSSLRPLPIPPPRPPPPIDHDGEISGAITSGGKPVAGAEIRLEPHWQEYDDARALPPIVAHTDAHGGFAIHRAPTIVWTVVIRAPGMTTAGYVADLRASKLVQLDRVSLDAAATIAGVVVGPDKRVAAGVHITHVTYDGRLDVDVTSGADGRYLIDAIRPTGRYDLVARRADGAVAAVSLQLAKPGRVPRDIVLRAPTDPHVARVIVVGADGAPVADRRVVFDNMQTVTTDATGAASADIGDEPRISISVYGGPDPVVVDLPQQAPLTIRLSR